MSHTKEIVLSSQVHKGDIRRDIIFTGFLAFMSIVQHVNIYLMTPVVAKSENENAIASKDRPGNVDWIIDEIVNNADTSEKTVLQYKRLVKLHCFR